MDGHRKRGMCKRLHGIVMTGILVIGMLYTPAATEQVEAAGGTAAELVALAASQVGYHEKASNANLDDFYANSGSNNYNKYARDIGVANGYAWCATFIWWCMRTANVPESAYPSRTTVTRDWFNERGLYRARGTYTPKPGDYVVFGNVAHCGIVESVSGNTMCTIEGNSSDQVKRNTYALTNSYILGYGIINYNGSSSGSNTSTGTGQTDNPGSPYPIPSGNLRVGSRGDNVKWIQKFANDVMGAGIAVDGIYGNQTAYAVRVFQQNNGLSVDGVCGAQTTGKMLTVWRNKIAEQKKAEEAKKQPLNLGNSFTGLIIRKDIWKTIRNNGTNVELYKEEENGMFYWVFTRQSDGSYVIKSEYDGKVLDAYGLGTANGTNVFASGYNGGNNQKWFIYQNGDGYRIVPKHAANRCLDIAGAGTGNGVNAQIYEWNDTAAQRFAIYKDSFGVITGINLQKDGKNVDSIEAEPGDSFNLKATLVPSNTMCKAVDWSSSDSNIAAVDSSGKVTVKKEGVVNITVKSHYSDSIKDSVKIEVKEPVTTEEITTEETKEEEKVEATTEETATEEATTEEATTEEATTEEVTTEEKTTEEKSTEQATTEKTTPEEKTTEQLTDEVGKDENKDVVKEEEKEEVNAEEKPAEETTTEETTTEEATTEEATTEEATTEEVTTEEKSTEQATSEQATTEKTTPEEKTTEQLTDKAGKDENKDVVKEEKSSDDMDEGTEENDNEEEEDFVFEYDNDNYSDDSSDEDKIDVGDIIESEDGKSLIKVTKMTGDVYEAYYYEPLNYNAQSITVKEYISALGFRFRIVGISSGAFSDCRKLKTVKLPKSIRVIEEEAFINCKKLKKIEIPTSVTRIGKKAFKNCKKLSKIVFAGTNVKSIGKKAFNGIKKTAIFKIPKSCAKKYKKMIKKAK